MLKLPFSTKLHLRCISQNISANDDYLLLPLVSAQLYNPAPVEFKSSRIAAYSMGLFIQAIVSTSIPTSTNDFSDDFTGDMESDAELVLSFELFEFDH